MTLLCSSPQVQSNLGKIILKEELDKGSAPLRRKTRSLPDRSQHAGRWRHQAPPPHCQRAAAHLCSSAGSSRAVYFPASSKSSLSRVSGRGSARRPITAQPDVCVCVFVSSCARPTSARRRKRLQVGRHLHELNQSRSADHLCDIICSLPLLSADLQVV